MTLPEKNHSSAEACRFPELDIFKMCWLLTPTTQALGGATVTGE